MPLSQNLGNFTHKRIFMSYLLSKSGLYRLGPFNYCHGKRFWKINHNLNTIRGGKASLCNHCYHFSLTTSNIFLLLKYLHWLHKANMAKNKALWAGVPMTLTVKEGLQIVDLTKWSWYKISVYHFYFPVPEKFFTNGGGGWEKPYETKRDELNHKIRLESRLVQLFIQTPNHMVGPVMPSAHTPSWPHLTSSKIYLWVTSWYSDILLPLYDLSFSSQPLFQGDFFHEGPFEQPWISWDIEQLSITRQH